MKKTKECWYCFREIDENSFFIEHITHRNGKRDDRIYYCDFDCLAYQVEETLKDRRNDVKESDL